MSDKYARWTFNDSAKRLFPPEAKGLRVKIDDETIFVNPTRNSWQIPFMTSPSGMMADIDSADSQSDRIMQILQNSGFSAKEPFFILCDQPGGWMTIEHFPFEKPPSKGVPHFRVWPLRWEPGAARHNEVFDMQRWPEMRTMILRAGEIIGDQKKKVGRPPKIVQQAQDVMGSLNQLMGELARINGIARPAIVHQSVSEDAPDDLTAKVMQLIERNRMIR